MHVSIDVIDINIIKSDIDNQKQSLVIVNLQQLTLQLEDQIRLYSGGWNYTRRLCLSNSEHLFRLGTED